jgi:molybdopterin synthase catalytic subunit
MEAYEQSIHVSVSDEPIDAGGLLERVGRPDSGAVVLFLGTVRNHSEGKSGVTHLDYEVYPEMVEEKISEVIVEAAKQWPLLSVAVEHRSGVVGLGQVSVAVAVSTAHRSDAFESARFVIDQLKERVPIWKKEFWEGGSDWSAGS